MNKEKHLYRILFLVSIFLLLINDFYLKYEYHNYLTGKLSDFPGLFAFSIFFQLFIPEKNKADLYFKRNFIRVLEIGIFATYFDFITLTELELTELSITQT